MKGFKEVLIVVGRVLAMLRLSGAVGTA